MFAYLRKSQPVLYSKSRTEFAGCNKISNGCCGGVDRKFRGISVQWSGYEKEYFKKPLEEIQQCLPEPQPSTSKSKPARGKSGNDFVCLTLKTS